jgi:hypothetical protein
MSIDIHLVRDSKEWSLTAEKLRGGGTLRKRFDRQDARRKRYLKLLHKASTTK